MSYWFRRSVIQKNWDESKVNRHPAGAPAGKGGEFAPKDGAESGSLTPESLPKDKITPTFLSDLAVSPTPAEKLNHSYPPPLYPEDFLKFEVPPEQQQAYQKAVAEMEKYVRENGTTEQKYTDPSGQYSPERKALHTQILAEEMKNWEKYLPENGERPELVLLGGRGGSGKSQFANENGAKVYDHEKFFVADPDRIKDALLKAEFGFEKREYAYAVHEESSYINKKLVAMAKQMGINIAIDKTMASPMDREVERFTSNEGGPSYKVRAYFMHVPLEKSYKQAFSRWYSQSQKKPGTGRLVPLDVIHQNTMNEYNFDRLTSNPKVSEWALYSNDVPRGSKPIKIASGRRQ